MNLRFIEAFVWVARLRSFTAAAEKLYTTQAAISARIATLEDDFGVKLFERDKRTVTLTHSGEELLKYAEQLLGISARMLEAVSDRATYEGFVSVGVIEAVVHTWLPELLERLRQQFPKVRVEIHSYITADLHEELLNGNIDLALTAEALANPAIQNSSICNFQIGWITAPNASRKSAALGCRAPEPSAHPDVPARLARVSGCRREARALLCRPHQPDLLDCRDGVAGANRLRARNASTCGNRARARFRRVDCPRRSARTGTVSGHCEQA